MRPPPDRTVATTSQRDDAQGEATHGAQSSFPLTVVLRPIPTNGRAHPTVAAVPRQRRRSRRRRGRLGRNDDRVRGGGRGGLEGERHRDRLTDLQRLGDTDQHDVRAARSEEHRLVGRQGELSTGPVSSAPNLRGSPRPSRTCRRPRAGDPGSCRRCAAPARGRPMWVPSGVDRGSQHVHVRHRGRREPGRRTRARATAAGAEEEPDHTDQREGARALTGRCSRGASAWSGRPLRTARCACRRSGPAASWPRDGRAPRSSTRAS